MTTGRGSFGNSRLFYEGNKAVSFLILEQFVCMFGLLTSGAILLTLSLGLIGMTHELTTQIGAVSAIMILIAGAVCFVLR